MLWGLPQELEQMRRVRQTVEREIPEELSKSLYDTVAKILRDMGLDSPGWFYSPHYLDKPFRKHGYAWIPPLLTDRITITAPRDNPIFLHTVQLIPRDKIAIEDITVKFTYNQFAVKEPDWQETTTVPIEMAMSIGDIVAPQRVMIPANRKFIIDFTNSGNHAGTGLVEFDIQGWLLSLT